MTAPQPDEALLTPYQQRALVAHVKAMRAATRRLHDSYVGSQIIEGEEFVIVSKDALMAARWEQTENALEQLFLAPAPAPVWQWRPIESAPKDGTLLLLRVEYADSDLGSHPLETVAEPTPDGLGQTIGFNNLDNDGEDIWKLAGWDWDQDEFVQGRGVPKLWMPLPPPPEKPR